MKGNIRSSPLLSIALSLQNDKYTKAEMFKYKEVEYYLGFLNPIYGLLLNVKSNAITTMMQIHFRIISYQKISISKFDEELRKHLLCSIFLYQTQNICSLSFRLRCSKHIIRSCNKL